MPSPSDPAPPEPGALLFETTSRAFSRRALRSLFLQITKDLTQGRPFTCLIANDAELRRLNRQFRKKDYPTDVLSFPSGEPSGWLGEIAISADRAQHQASQFGHSRLDELGILMLHGALHLLGMDHETDSGSMARAEKAWRKRLGLPASLTERAHA